MPRPMKSLTALGLVLALGWAAPALADDVSLTWEELPPVPANASTWSDAIPVGETWWRQLGLAGD